MKNEFENFIKKNEESLGIIKNHLTSEAYDYLFAKFTERDINNYFDDEIQRGKTQVDIDNFFNVGLISLMPDMVAYRNIFDESLITGHNRYEKIKYKQNQLEAYITILKTLKTNDEKIFMQLLINKYKAENEGIREQKISKRIIDYLVNYGSKYPKSDSKYVYWNLRDNACNYCKKCADQFYPVNYIPLMHSNCLCKFTYYGGKFEYKNIYLFSANEGNPKLSNQLPIVGTILKTMDRAPSYVPYNKTYDGHDSNCTWWAAARYKEDHGYYNKTDSVYAKPQFDNEGNSANNRGYEIKAKSIAVIPDKHVIYIEHLDGNDVYFSEANVSTDKNFVIQKLSLDEFKAKGVKWYIY